MHHQNTYHAFLFKIKNNSDCGFIIITLLLIKQDLTTCFHTGIINSIDLPTSSVRSVSSLLMVPVTVVTFEAREVIATSLQDHIKIQCKILLLQFTSCKLHQEIQVKPKVYIRCLPASLFQFCRVPCCHSLLESFGRFSGVCRLLPC